MLKELDDDKIIVGDDIIKVISISNKNIIKEINNEFRCIGICVIRKKKIFLIGGYNNKINIYRSDSFELIETINNAHDDWIYGITQLKNNLIASYGRDRIIKVWLI
jgi:WD40 repeat protein